MANRRIFLHWLCRYARYRADNDLSFVSIIFPGKSSMRHGQPPLFWLMMPACCSAGATIEIALRCTPIIWARKSWVSGSASLPHKSRKQQPARQARFDRAGRMARARLLGQCERRLLMSRQRCSKSDAPIGDRLKIRNVESGVRTAFLTSSINPELDGSRVA